MEQVCMYEEKDTKQIITLSIQEIVSDFYKLAEEEGFLSGLAEVGACEESDKEAYLYEMELLANKYIPNYEKFVNQRFFAEDATDDEKGVLLSKILCENFKEIFYKLV